MTFAQIDREELRLSDHASASRLDVTFGAHDDQNPLGEKGSAHWFLLKLFERPNRVVFLTSWAVDCMRRDRCG